MMRKAQITVFIILGILILIGAFLAMGLRDDGRGGLTIGNDDSVRRYVDECHQDLAREAVTLIGIQGGYIHPVHYREELFLKRSFLIYEGIPYIPSKEIIEEELAEHMEQDIVECLNVSMFPDKEITAGTPVVDVSIGADRVIISTDFPIRVSEDGAEQTIRRFTSNVDLPLGKARDKAEDIVLASVEDPGVVDFNVLEDTMFNITVSGNYMDAVRYTMIDKDSSYVFSFYEHVRGAISPEDNKGPQMEAQEKIIAMEGEQVSVKLKAHDPEGDMLIYSDDSMLFDIDATTGLISFVPDVKGTHIAPVYVEDTHGNFDFQLLEIDVR